MKEDFDYVGLIHLQVQVCNYEVTRLVSGLQGYRLQVTPPFFIFISV
jgi:hypothetical protein